jgi:hypothetical protein
MAAAFQDACRHIGCAPRFASRFAEKTRYISEHCMTNVPQSPALRRPVEDIRLGFTAARISGMLASL